MPKITTKRKKPDVKFKCETCMREYKIKKRFDNHKCIKVCSDDIRSETSADAKESGRDDNTTNAIICDEDQQKLLSEHELNRHKLSHNSGSNERKFECSFCKKRYSNLSRLNRHEITHTGLRLSCQFPNCDKSFTRSDNLNQHIRKAHAADGYQNGEEIMERGFPKAYICDACGKQLSTFSELTKHKLIHMNRETPIQFMCNECGKVYDNLTRLSQHERTHQKSNRFCCPFPNCDKSYTAKKNLQDHLEKVHANDRTSVEEAVNLACKICLKMFGSQEELKGHICFECNVCKREYFTKKGFDNHKCVKVCSDDIRSEASADAKESGRDDNTTNAIICDEDQQKLLSEHELNLHKLNHKSGSTERKFECGFCKKRYSNLTRLKRHEITHTGLRISCQFPNCDKSFTRSDNLNQHIRKAHAVDGNQSSEKIMERDLSNVFICDACGKQLSTFSQLSKHQLAHLTPETQMQFKCDECGKLYDNLTRLSQHERTHQKTNRFWCPIPNCDKSYTAKKSLQTHLEKAHADDGTSVKEAVNFPCKICLKNFGSQEELTGHICFECNICKRVFTSSQGLTNHKIQTKGNCLSRLVCDFCAKKFDDLKELRIHRNIHTGEKPYSCNKCELSFAQPSSLRAHMRTTHKDNLKSLTHCTICDKTLSTPTSLKNHMQRFHQHWGNSTRIHEQFYKATNDSGESSTAETFQCDICTRVFHSQGGLTFHKNSGTCGKNSCEVCGEICRSSAYLRQHKVKRHGERPLKFSGKIYRGKCKYCNKGFFMCRDHLQQHQKRCARKNDWKCVHCETVFDKKKLYIAHVRNFCPERTFSFKCYCKNSKDFNPENVHEVLKHIIKCNPASGGSRFRCYICNHPFKQRFVSLHIQDEVLHSSLVNYTDCKHECTKCKIKYPTEELLILHTEVEHPCLTRFLQDYTETVLDIGFSVTNKDLLRQEREENHKLEQENLKFNGNYPESRCYVCHLPIFSIFIKRRHIKFCEKKYKVVQPVPAQKPSILPPSNYQLRKQKGKVVHNKLTPQLARKLFHRIEFDLNSCLRTWVERVGSTSYLDQIAWEMSTQPYLVKKWLTTFTKAEQEDEDSLFSKHKNLILEKLPRAIEEDQSEISILINWEAETKTNKQFVTIDLTGPSQKAVNDQLTPEDITKAMSSGVFYRKCTTCDKVCTSLEEYYRHNHNTAMKYFRSKNTSRQNANKPRALKGRKKEWLTEKEKEPGKYDDLTPWIFEGKVPKHPCGICGKPFHGRFMKHAHQRRCKKMLGVPDFVVDTDEEENQMDTEEANVMDTEEANLMDKEEANLMDTEEANLMDTEEANLMDTEEANLIETEEKVLAAVHTGPRLVLLRTD